MGAAVAAVAAWSWTCLKRRQAWWVQESAEAGEPVPAQALMACAVSMVLLVLQTSARIGRTRQFHLLNARACSSGLDEQVAFSAVSRAYEPYRCKAYQVRTGRSR